MTAESRISEKKNKQQLLGIGKLNTLQRQRINMQQERNCSKQLVIILLSEIISIQLTFNQLHG
jgi:hypothetical protein